LCIRILRGIFICFIQYYIQFISRTSYPFCFLQCKCKNRDEFINLIVRVSCWEV
jgi:hypothetical protein